MVVESGRHTYLSLQGGRCDCELLVNSGDGARHNDIFLHEPRLFTIAPMPTVFFSWQSDRLQKHGRYFIEEAIKAAIARLAQDPITFQDAEREPVAFDKDTKDEPGFVKIFDVILEKIDKASVFVPDFTFVALRPNKKPTPNPNVLIEYGYALKSYGPGGERRLMPVMNVAFGEPSSETLPFDLTHHRNAITYNLPDDADATARKQQLAQLTGAFYQALKLFFESQFYKDTFRKSSAFALRKLRKPEFGEARFRTQGEPIGTFQDIASQFVGSPQPKRYFLNDGPAMWLRVTTNLASSRTLNITELNKRMADSGPFP